MRGFLLSLLRPCRKPSVSPGWKWVLMVVVCTPFFGVWLVGER